MTFMTQPMAISQLRKQIICSHIPVINSLAVLKLKDEFSSQEILRFFRNANYLTGKMVHKESQYIENGILLVLNVDRSFLVKYSKTLNLDVFDYLLFNRKSNNITIESVIFESIKNNQSGGFKTIAKSIFNYSLDQNSLISHFYKLKRNPKFIIVSSEYKNMKYYGKRLSFSKVEIDRLEDYDELTNSYKMEIIERQRMLKWESNLTESFIWKNRGIINNMFCNIQEIENRYKKHINLWLLFLIGIPSISTLGVFL